MSFRPQQWPNIQVFAISTREKEHYTKKVWKNNGQGFLKYDDSYKSADPG